MRTWLSGLVLVVFAAGCGSKADKVVFSHGGEEGQKISILISMLNDEKSNPDSIKRHFATGTGPAEADQQKYPFYSYALKGNPTIEGESATAVVALRPEHASLSPAEMEWTFVNQGGAWKLKTAPMP